MATALVTGATAGIGNAFAKELAKRGYDIVLVARDTDRLESVATTLRTDFGVHAEVLSADLAEREDLLRVRDRVEDAERPIEVLVNKAGFGLHSDVLDPDFSVHERAMDVMCLAVLVLAGAAGRAMKARGHGRIINVSSTSGEIMTGNYSAIKAWVTSYSQGLGIQLAGTGVSVTAVCPGWVRTEFHQRAGISANFPEFVWIDAHQLVRECLADVTRGKVESVPTLKWKAAMFVADHGPRGFIRWFSPGSILPPGTNSAASTITKSAAVAINGLKFLVVFAQITFPISSTVVPNIKATSAFIGFSNR